MFIIPLKVWGTSRRTMWLMNMSVHQILSQDSKNPHGNRWNSEMMQSKSDKENHWSLACTSQFLNTPSIELHQENHIQIQYKILLFKTYPDNDYWPLPEEKEISNFSLNDCTLTPFLDQRIHVERRFHLSKVSVTFQVSISSSSSLYVFLFFLFIFLKWTIQVSILLGI